MIHDRVFRAHVRSLRITCPKPVWDCKSAWTCPSCQAEMHHVQFCTRCGFGYCSMCLGSGTIEDDSYTWASPRTVRCPECGGEAA